MKTLGILIGAALVLATAAHDARATKWEPSPAADPVYAPGEIGGRNHTCEDFWLKVRRAAASCPRKNEACRGLRGAILKPNGSTFELSDGSSYHYFNFPKPGHSTLYDKCKVDIKSCKPIEGVSEAEIDWKMLIDPEAIRKRGGPPYARWDWRCSKEDMMDNPTVLHEYRFDPGNLPEHAFLIRKIKSKFKVNEPPIRHSTYPGRFPHRDGYDPTQVRNAGSLGSTGATCTMIVGYGARAARPRGETFGDGYPHWANRCAPSSRTVPRGHPVVKFCILQAVALGEFVSQCRKFARRCKPNEDLPGGPKGDRPSGRVDWWFNWYPNMETATKGRIGGGELACAK